MNSDEYQVIGSGTYGEPTYVDRICRELIDLKKTGRGRSSASSEARPPVSETNLPQPDGSGPLDTGSV